MDIRCRLNFTKLKPFKQCRQYGHYLAASMLPLYVAITTVWDSMTMAEFNRYCR